MFSTRAALLPAAFALLAAAPCIACAQNDAPAKKYDMRAEALLQAAADRLKNAQSFSGQVTTILHVPATNKEPAREVRSAKIFTLQKPNRIYQEFGPLTQTTRSAWNATLVEPPFKWISDGKKGAAVYLDRKSYRKTGVTRNHLSWYQLTFPEFFDPARSAARQARYAKADGRLISLQMAPNETFGGVPCAVVVEKMRSENGEEATAVATTKIYVGKKDGLIHGYHREYPSPKGNGTMRVSDDVLTNIALNRKIPASVFALKLTGYKEIVVPKRLPLLASGTVAPDFTAYDKDGKAVKLSDFKGKVVVLDFWATWCGPCIASLPHTTKVAQKTADQGVVVLAVNVWDKQAEFDKWLPAHPEYAPLTFVIDTTPGQGQDVATKLYNVSGIPTQYVIDRNGKIVTSLVGYGGSKDALEKAIAKADAGKSQ